jgi:hypothetical protein
MSQEIREDIDSKTLECLKEYTEEGKNYSKKLEENILAVMNTFGDSEICRICGYQKTPQNHETHKFIPRINIRLDEEVTVSIDNNRYLKFDSDGEIHFYDEDGGGFPNNARQDYKDIVKSHALERLITIVGKTLIEETEEYKQVSKIAENLYKATLGGQ